MNEPNQDRVVTGHGSAWVRLRRCSEKCREAKGAKCECICKAKNHGSAARRDQLPLPLGDENGRQNENTVDRRHVESSDRV